VSGPLLTKCSFTLKKRVQHRSISGYTLVELVVGLVVGAILTAIAIPQVDPILNKYRLQGAVASSTWAIQSTRYQALMAGYPYQVVFTKSAGTYQIQNLPAGASSYTNVGAPVPLSGSAITLNQDTTLQFKPNGAVTATTGALNFTLSYNGASKTVTVSTYGNISVAP
jgi:prepilin-type N-terminal cleavage/methylation domain-containing protein